MHASPPITVAVFQPHGFSLTHCSESVGGGQGIGPLGRSGGGVPARKRQSSPACAVGLSFAGEGLQVPCSTADTSGLSLFDVAISCA
jgi:hypothetical protein